MESQRQRGKHQDLTYLDEAQRLFPEMRAGRIIRCGCPDALPALRITLRCLTPDGDGLPEDCGECWQRPARSQMTGEQSGKNCRKDVRRRDHV